MREIVVFDMQTNLDRFAILLSGICTIHCVALPIAASVIPVLTSTIQHGHQLHEFWFHQFILLFILPISVIALVTGFRTHRQITPLVIAGLGLAILAGVALFAETMIANLVIPHSSEMIITVAGGDRARDWPCLKCTGNPQIRPAMPHESLSNENISILVCRTVAVNVHCRRRTRAP